MADLVVEIGLSDLFDVDVVGLLKDLDLFASDWTKDTNGKTRSWEWVALDKGRGDGEQATESADFVYTRVKVSGE